MAAQDRRKWLTPAIIGVALLLLAAAFLLFRMFQKSTPTAYVPGDYPEGVSFADVVTEAGLSDEERYAAYDPGNDPAHPVLDVKVKLSISNLGSRPGAPRPQGLSLEYPAQTLPPPATASPTPAPTPAPSATLKPGAINPGLKPKASLPPIELPELYIPQPDVPSPQYAGGKYTLAWEYTAGRAAVFAVSLSTDAGKTFTELATGLAEKSCELTFPAVPGEPGHCVLRVTALVEGRVYKTADTHEFTLASVELAHTPIPGYVDPQVQYVDMPGLRISSESGLPVWFNAENNAENAEKMVWQLSRIPFWGTKEIFGSEAGILASGEIGKAGGEFSIDLKALCEELSKPDSERGADQPFLPKSIAYEFHLRVVALDANGDCIGDPGQGLSFSYGPAEVLPDLNSTSFADNSKIALLLHLPVPYTSYSYEYRRVSPDVHNADLSDKADDVFFGGLGDSQEGDEIIKKAVKVELQVATSPFTNASALGFTQPDGLVYSYVDTAPKIWGFADGYGYFTPDGHAIEYEQFVPSKEELDAMGGIYYYVRGLFYVPDEENPSVLRPYPSETLTVAFRATPSYKNEIKKITVKSYAPYVQFWGYVPVQWEDPNYDEYFEVTRRIEAEEMNFTIRNTKTGDFLLRYKEHIAKYGWTREQYQAKLDQMLPQYASFRYVKSAPGFWDEFFGLLKAIYDGVSKAYANAKDAVVSLVDYIPLIGDDARGFLKKAATYAIDYGLMSIGLPPSLPNLDLLAEDGMDYLIKMGVDEALCAAGVPPDSLAAAEITEQVQKQLTDGLTNELTKAVLAQQQNPFRASFLRISRAKLYRPAHVAVFVKNYSKTHTTPAGTVSFSCGNSFDIYKTRVVDIPPLKPGESTTVYLYLDHLRNQYDGYNKYFDKKYYGDSGKPYIMRVGASFDIPDVRVAAREQGIAPAPLPYVTEYVYDHPGYLYERDFVPAEWFWEPDSSQKTNDYTD
jgi:hypothetical protein